MDKDDSDDDDGFIAKEEETQPLHNEPDDVSSYIKGSPGPVYTNSSASTQSLWK